ncbi:ROK family protein [Succinatimonas hippei]|uniref:ROK family protein n=1 Tax=Succinatimonas hippei TaxID=626938 RepID=UPI0024922113|nr:ROK family protein [Succinatimonas hippei]
MNIGAFDIGGTKTIVALADDAGTIYEKQQFPTDTGDCLRHLDTCCQIFSQFLCKHQLHPQNVSGIGINLPGMVDRKQGILLRAVYAGWNNVPVKDYLVQKLHVSNIVCENDVNSCAVGELRFGLGRQYKDFGWMTVSTGVGGAVVCNGRLIRGVHGFAGEFGHLKVEYDEPYLCPCGDKGCLEAHGSGTALNRLINEKAATDSAFKDAFTRLGTAPSAAACAILARSGNLTAISIFTEIGCYLGRGIAYYANILDPEAVIIGGGVSASLDLLMPGINKSLEKYAFDKMKHTRVLRTALGYEAALMGAIAIVQ